VTGYDVIARYYDLDHETFFDDIELYRRFVARNGLVLVAGMGTGRVVAGLAAQSQQIVGFDTSEAMLSVARAKLKSLRNVTILNADMRSLDLRRKFDSILVPLDVFSTLLARDHRSQSLACLADHLGREGSLIIDVTNQEDSCSPDVAQWRPRFEVWTEGGCIRGFDRIETKGVTTTVYLRYDTIRMGRTLSEHTEIHLGWVSIEEMVSLCDEAGLDVVDIFGDYDGCRWSDSSPRSIYVVKLRRGHPIIDSTIT
jgi:SAM-dependent methyltransferase